MKRIVVFTTVFVLYALARSMQGLIDYDMARLFFSSATFLFGIFIAFSISNAHNRINTIFETLNKHNAELLYIYSASHSLGAEIQKRIQKHIDDYLISQLDYILKDFKHSFNAYTELASYLQSLSSTQLTKQKIIESYIQKQSDLIHQRKQVEVSVRSKLVFNEWLVLYLLSGFIIYFIFYLSDTSIFSLVSSFALVSIVAILIILLQSLDDLSWKEVYKIWRPLHQLFLELDLVPYYPEEALKDKRPHIRKGEKIRIAHYPNPYPDLSGKIVKTVVWNT